MLKVGCVAGGIALMLNGCSHKSHNTTKPSKCHALALSGGGDKVAWVAGVVQGLINTLNDTSATEWQVVTGAGTGALLASLAATYKLGDEAQMSSDLISTISGFTNVPAPAHVSMSWPANIDAANQSGLVNSSVLTQTLTSIFSGRNLSDRQFSISGMSDETGKLMIWDDASVSGAAQWVDYIAAAMSSPGVDEPVNVNGEMYSSGSVILGTDVFSAILKCQAAGYENTDIVVDVVTGDHPTLSPWNATTDDVTMKLAARGDELSAYNLQMSDIFDACDAYPNVSWRYFVQPSVVLPSAGDNYNATQMAQMVQMGIVDAQNASTGGHCSIADSFRKSKSMMSSKTEDRAVEAPQCYAMALSGGGAKGAYEAGVLKGLIDGTNSSEHQWQLFTGISAGSILSAGAALFDVGDEENMADFLMEHILDFINYNATAGNVFVDWPNPMMQLTESGFENTQPLFETLQGLYSMRPLGNRKFAVGATRDADGKLVVFDETDVMNEDGSFNATSMAAFVRASAAIPGVFESVTINGLVHSDGGVVMGTNVYSAVNRCKAAGYAESDIVIDTITCNSARLSTWNETLHNHAGDIKARATEIQTFALAMADIFDACRAYPEVNWRYYVQAPTDLPGTAASFNAESMQAMLNVGLADAKNASVGIHCSQAEQFRKSRIVKDILQPQVVSNTIV